MQVFFGCSAEAEEDPWKFVNPVGTTEATFQGCFEVPVIGFDETVCLRVVCGGRM
jgi:hypothetical protein